MPGNAPLRFLEWLVKLRARSWIGYALAMAGAAFGTGIRFALGGALVGAPFVTFFPGILLASFTGGVGAGAVGAFASGLLAIPYLTIPTWATWSAGWVAIFAFAFISALLIALADLAARAIGRLTSLTTRLQEANQTLEARVADRTRDLTLLTAQLREEIKFREAAEIEEQLQLATEAADIGWWDVAQGHGRLTWPPRVKAMFGISPDAPVTMDDFYSGLHLEDRDHVAAAYAAAADPARRALYDVEYRTIGKEDGVVRWIAAKGRGVFDETGNCKRVIGTAIDITERKLAQEEKRAREKQDAELREQFIAILGHDLRNPLASVAAGTRTLLRSPERAAEIAEQIERSITRMAKLIENVLDFARGRLGGGFITMRDSEQPLKPVLLEVIEELVVVHPERQVTVDIDLREPVECDRQRIGQLLSNLLGNAVVYGTPDEPIQVHARADAGLFELSITNSGETIEKSVVDRLFLPFFRGRTRGSREGLGLGLYICSEIAKAHEGTISVSSEDGTTCFILRMPTTTLQAKDKARRP